MRPPPSNDSMESTFQIRSFLSKRLESLGFSRLAANFCYDFHKGVVFRLRTVDNIRKTVIINPKFIKTDDFRQKVSDCRNRNSGETR